MAAVASTPVDRETEMRERFVRETAKHEMTVLHDDGLYRHLRFKQPGTSFYWYDLITWPGRLAIAGDCGDYTFARSRDMFEFFAASDGRINPHYWGEKLQGPTPGREGVLRFEADLFRPRVMEWFEETAEDLDDEETRSLRQAVEDQLFCDLYDGPHTRDDAMRLLGEFEHKGTHIYEPYDWSLREWDWSYLWCCWAIVEGIARYQHAKSWL